MTCSLAAEKSNCRWKGIQYAMPLIFSTLSQQNERKKERKKEREALKMCRALLSAFLRDLSDALFQLISETRTSSSMKSIGRDLDNLNDTLDMVDLLVDDAEEKQFQDVAKAQVVNMWVNRLHDAVCRLEEHVQEWKSLQGKGKVRTQGRQLFFRVLLASKKQKSMRASIIMEVQIHESIEDLEVLVKEKDVLGLTECASSTWRQERKSLRLQALPSCSAVLDNYFHGSYPRDYFYGRHEEEKYMLEILLSTTETEQQHIKVINIVAKVGAGKTAFADIIFFSHNVKEFFQLRAWVNTPYKVSVTFLAKKILEAVTEEFIPDDHFDVLRMRLQESFAGKRFLLVLDDIRLEEEEEGGDSICFDKWNTLIASFEAAAARGSAIILTSTPYDDRDPLFLPPATHTVHLALLSTENLWSIFLVHALGQMDLHDGRPELEAVDKEFVNKFGNLPMAAKMIGSLNLWQDKTLHLSDWVEILTGRLRHVNFPFPSFLFMCYLHIPSQLKRCFAYLSIFPKAYQFKKTEAVLLWMAQGFLLSSDKTKSMEDVGDEYFGYLVMRSFLQPFGSGVSFIMHNQVHDLASYVFGNSYKYHLSYSGSTQNLGELLFGRHQLRTILPLEGPPRQFRRQINVEEIIWRLNPLVCRVLSLSQYDITNLPAAIGTLSHLCYLDLSHTDIHTLPDSICDLLNLQTLLLTNCSYLKSFPQRMCNLINLRYLDVRNSGVQEMPLKMHKLTSLRTLTDFFVSKNRPRFGDLAALTNLKTLTISKLQNVAYAKAASDAKLKKKKSLDDLMLQWGNGNDSNENEMEVLENLEAHKNLKRLTIEYYGGARFPNWLGDPSRWALQLVDIRRCESCISLPTLGLLPLLKDLFIEGFTKISSIGHDFFGVMTASHKPFQSLQSLQFQDMLEWKEWNIPEGVDFPRLKELYIIRCPKLVGNLPKQLLSLEKLEIFGCYDLVAPLPKVSNTCEVFVHNSNEILMRNVVKNSSQASLRRVTISEEVQEITPQSYSGFPSTRYTFGSSLGEIEEIGDETKMETEFKGNRLPSNPASLDTIRIPKLKELSSGLVSDQVESDIPNIKLQTEPQSSLAKADIPIATQAAVFPLTDTPNTTAVHVKVETLSTEDLDDQRSSFETLKVSAVSQLKFLPPKLQSLKIEGCEYLETLPDDFLDTIPTLQELYLIGSSSLRSFPFPASLTTLYIRNCRSLEFLPFLESRHKHPSLHHLLIGSSCDSLTTLPLDLFSELKILCIWDCLNLLSFYVTGEFRGALTSLESLEIRDCPRLRSFPDKGLHTPNLASIFLSNCKDLNKLPNSMNSLTSLKSLFLHRCPQIESFPFGGLPSSLFLLSIAYCDKLTPQEDWGLNKLESLNHFELEGGCMGMESFPEEKLLPSNISSLRISKMQSLKKLDYKGFQHLNALHTLEIHCCDILRSLPEHGLPSSLNYLCVQECPLLTPRLKPKTGKEWHKVAHIPHLQIDHQVLS